MSIKYVCNNSIRRSQTKQSIMVPLICQHTNNYSISCQIDLILSNLDISRSAVKQLFQVVFIVLTCTLCFV